MRSSRDAFEYFEYGMTLAGWLPTAKRKQLYWVYRIVVFWAITYFPLGMFTNYIKEIDSYTPGELLTSIQVAINDLGPPLKVTISLLNMWRYHKAKELLSRLDDYSEDREKKIGIDLDIRRCNSIFIVYEILYSVYCAATYFASVFNGATPWRMYNPFIDWRAGPSNLWLASTLEFVIILYVGTQEALTDGYPLLCGLLLRMHIKDMHQRINQLRTDPNESERQSYERLLKCIANHKLLLEYADLIRPIISGTIFIQLLLIGVILGCAIVNVLIFANFWSGVATVIYIVALFAQTFPFCYTCDLIKNDCAELSVAIFHSNWLNASRGYKSTLIYFLQKAQTPIVYTAGSVFPICMETNIKLAKLAFSVVAFVKQLNLAEKLRRGN